MTTLSLQAVRGQVLSGTSLELSRGLHVVLGAPHDGTAELIEICAGAALPRSGWARLGGRYPAADAELRRRIGALLPSEALPPAPNVEQAARRVLALRGQTESDARPALEALGLEALLLRDPRALSAAELGAVALALALSVREPALVALHEPLLRARTLSPERLLARLRAAAEDAVVLCTTASARDAVTLSEAVVVLDRGRISRSPVPALTELVPGHAPEFHVVTPAARALAALLSAEPDVTGVTLDGGGTEPGLVRVRASDATAGAAAISRAVVQGRIPLHALYMTLPELESVRAATAALAGVAHAQAQQAALAYYGAPR